MKLSAIILITMNLWGSFFCCCQDLVCGNDAQAACHNQAEMPSTEIGPEASCHSTQKAAKAPPAMACHSGSHTSATNETADSTETRSNVSGMCSCGNHAATELSFTVPSGETMPQIVWHLSKISRFFSIQDQTRAENSQNHFYQHLDVTIHRAPSLSALGCFLI